MADNEHDITDKDRYNRFSEDWRFHYKLIWEIPSVASAIFIGILAISYISLDFLLRAAALGVGAALILGLTFSVRKHRFGLSKDEERFPVRSSEALS